MASAAEQFERMAQDKASSDWERSAGAYWTARAHLRNRRPELVNQWLKTAAEYPRTFYGQLARKRARAGHRAAPAAPGLTAAGATALLQSKVGQRVLALVQIGEDDRAAAELQNLPTDEDDALRRAVIAVSEMMPDAAAGAAPGGGEQLLPTARTSTPRSIRFRSGSRSAGFTVDRALLYA